MEGGISSEINWLKECSMTVAALPMGSFTLNYSTLKYSSASCREKRNIFALSKLCTEVVALRLGLSLLIYVNRP